MLQRGPAIHGNGTELDLHLNHLFGIAGVLVFLYFAVIAPTLFYADLPDELWTVLLIFNAGVKFVSYGLSAISINQEG